MASIITIEHLYTELHNTKAWTPLVQFPVKYSKIDDHLVYLGAGIYGRTRDVNARLQADPLAPFLARLFWASSEGAARRIADMQIEADDGANNNLPSLLAFGLSEVTVTNLRTLAKERSLQTFESAAYRVMPDGKLVSWTLRVENLEYCFRTGKCETEPPYGVVIHHKDGYLFSLPEDSRIS